jgi:diguanylate cyclase (GGDEF)-like protein
VTLPQPRSVAVVAYGPRTAISALVYLCTVAVLYERRAPWWVWLVQGCLCLVWPHVAYQISRRAPNATRAEKRNMLIEHAFVGAGMSAMAFSTLPSVLMITTTVTNNILANGNLRLLGKGLAWHAAGIVVGLALYGAAWEPRTSMPQLLACLPLLLGYPFLIGKVVMVAMDKLREQRAHLTRLSSRDPLSDLFNRRHMDECIRVEFQRFLRTGQAASLALVDFDHFKHVNDTLGHEAGDEAIRRFGVQLQRTLRVTDTPGRFGGEEFVVLLPATTRHEAGVLMKRLQTSLISHPLLDSRPLTISVGVAEMSRDLPSPEAWIRLADQMLYRAKHRGRNRIEIAGEETTAPTTGPSANDEKIALPIEPYVLAGLEYGDIAAALFDPSDRLAWANDRFRALYQVPPGLPSFRDIMRHCHAHRVGARVQADDIEAWLAGADAKRRSESHRSFVIDSCDGRFYRMEEISMGDGWLLNLAMPHWERTAGAADVVPVLSA